jgi:pyruvate dehydrogenase E2 component (dihydrolipoamide acetyltransferase)
VDGKITSGHVMNISVSMDHRVIDGAEGAQFLNTLKALLENPVSLVI